MNHFNFGADVYADVNCNKTVVAFMEKKIETREPMTRVKQILLKMKNRLVLFSQQLKYLSSMGLLICFFCKEGKYLSEINPHFDGVLL